MLKAKLVTTAVVCLPLLFANKGSAQANIYIQTLSGVDVYNANDNGQLTLVSGSPFYDSGQMEGVNGNYLISVGTDYLHSYKLEANGGVGAQASQIDTQSYSGSTCGTTSGISLLDHTGQYFAVSLGGASATDGCYALQTYKINSSGDFTFLGDSFSNIGVHGEAYNTNVETYSSSDLYSYGVQSQQGATVWLAYKQASTGELETDSSFTVTGPEENPSVSGSNYAPWLVAADNAGHLAAVLNTPFDSSSAFQLGSYTINPSTGAISSTNTYANMPTLQVENPNHIGMAWGGNYLAVSGDPGLQVFHFNGANPPTAFGGVLLPNTQIDQVAWDKNNNLYALSYESNQLYVYTVTPTGITEAPGSPYTVSKPNGWTGIIVVPKS